MSGFPFSIFKTLPVIIPQPPIAVLFLKKGLHPPHSFHDDTGNLKVRSMDTYYINVSNLGFLSLL